MNIYHVYLFGQMTTITATWNNKVLPRKTPDTGRSIEIWQIVTNFDVKLWKKATVKFIFATVKKLIKF